MQAHHVVEHRVAQAAQRVDLHVFDGPLAQVAEHVAQQGRRDDEDAQEEHHVHHRVVGAVDFVEQEVDQPVEVVHVQREGGHRGDLCDLLRGVEQRVVRHKVDVTVSQRLLQRRRVHLLHVDSHVRKQRRKRGDQRGKHVGRLQRRAAQRQRAGQAVFGVADVLAQIFFQIEHLRCGVHIGAADVGQRFGRGAAVEDRRA